MYVERRFEQAIYIQLFSPPQVPNHAWRGKLAFYAIYTTGKLEMLQHATSDFAWVLAIGPGINYQYSNSELDTESNKPVRPF